MVWYTPSHTTLPGSLPHVVAASEVGLLLDGDSKAKWIPIITNLSLTGTAPSVCRNLSVLYVIVVCI